MLTLNKISNNLDFSLIAVWKDANPYIKKIENQIGKLFEIKHKIKVNWSKKNFALNALRFYEGHWCGSSDIFSDDFGHTKKIGSTEFIIFIVIDRKPKYLYLPSVSGSIELCNVNIVKFKEKIRNFVYEKTGQKYSLHSTNNYNEFCFQFPILFGIENTKLLLENSSLNCKGIFNHDLIGSSGWDSWEEVFEILNLTCNYVVLRGFENLPYKNTEKDLDLLTDDYQRVASILGLLQSKLHPYKGSMYVAGKLISVDVRFIGDHYFDTKFQLKVLENRTLNNGVYIPKNDDYFFSLLYHCKVHKKNVKSIYFDILTKLAIELELDWFSHKTLTDDSIAKNVLGGYYRANGYVYEKPIDSGVYENNKIIIGLPSINSSVNFMKILKSKVRHLTPNFLLSLRRKFLSKIRKK